MPRGYEKTFSPNNQQLPKPRCFFHPQGLFHLERELCCSHPAAQVLEDPFSILPGLSCAPIFLAFAGDVHRICSKVLYGFSKVFGIFVLLFWCFFGPFWAVVF